MTDNQEYKVLARKYRPQKFADLIGQESLVTILSNAIVNNRIAHAYVLTGVRGVGKTTTARLIAMSLNCQKRESKSFEPCGNCESCVSIRQDRNLDVIEIDAASKTGVDDIREIIDHVKYKPVNSTYKIFIIDEVHMLSKNAFNALLKTLEEPPEHVKFIFATTEVKKIPITILSRCQRFDLHRIENKLLTSHLFKVSELEKINIEQDAMTLIVRAADGSVRDGLSLLDQAIVNQNESISANQIAPNLKDDIYIPELERERGSEIAAKLTMTTLGLVWQVLFKGYQELQEGFHLHQHGEMIILRLIYLHDGPTPEDLLKEYKEQDKHKSEDISKKDSVIPTQINKNETINTNEENFILPDNKNTIKSNFSLPVDSYRKFVDLFYQHKEGMLHTQLYNNVRLISFKVGEVTLNTDSIKDPHFNRTVAKLISKWTGRIWQIHTSTSNVGKSLYEENLINQQKEIEKMKNHPEIKQILEAFPGVFIHSITILLKLLMKKM